MISGIVIPAISVILVTVGIDSVRNSFAKKDFLKSKAAYWGNISASR